MCWGRLKRSASPRPALAGVLLATVLTLVAAPPAQAADVTPLLVPPPAADQEAWLVTYGPGEIYWQRFGHNAIWLREPALGLDHAFNFGYFDFRQERFLRRFVMGRMLYFSLAQPAAAEFESYRRENRGIRAQKLDLRPDQYRRLRDHLLQQVRPENREYLYDYYLDNCSTRVRDALDLALDGALSTRFAALPARLGFRDHTRRLTAMDFWYYLGLQVALGAGVDRPANRWEEMFIPAVVADGLAEFGSPGGAGTSRLVTEQQVIFSAETPPPPAVPPAVWPRYLLTGLLLAAVFGGVGYLGNPELARTLALTWSAVSGLAGLVLAGLWALTDHQAAGANANLLLFHPLLLAGLPPAGRRLAAALLAAGAVSAVVIAAWHARQYTHDVLALAVPLHLVCALVIWRWPRGGGGREFSAGRERGRSPAA